MATPQSTPTKSSELSKKTLLKKYGRDDLPDVAEINLKKKKFTKINPNTFRSLRHLEEIRLDENQVDEIEVTTFADLTSLEHLYLTHNKLKRIDSPILKGLTQLECVAFDENQIDYIIPHLFKGLSNIKEIYLNSNKLTRIEAKTFRGLNILENLRLESNEISLIDPTSFEGLSNLKYLYIFRNKLTSIDSETFKGLNELEKLYMGDNPIVELDNKIFKDLTNLAELFLNDMKLTKIDPSLFRSLTKLKALDLNTNQIEEIDSKTFESFTNLKYLFLNGNKLRQIEPNTFKPLDKLLQLTIYDNQIEEIDSTIFETLVNLKELDLSCNKIKRIGSNLFSRLIKLEKLYLIDNQIEEIDENSFVSLINLHELKLENNKLTRFIRKWFENLPSKSVKLVDLRKNPADVVSYFETKFCARSKFDHTSGEVRFTSCWDEFIKQFPEPICEQVVETLPASDLASESISMDILPDISIVDEILQPTPLSDDLPIDDSNTRDQNRDKPAATESMVESTYSTAYSPSSSSSRSQQQNVDRVINRESLRPDINVFGNGDMTSISSIGMRPNNGERFSMNRGVRESLTFAQNTSNLSRLPNKMEIARQRESLRPDHSASTNSLSNQLIGEQIRGRFRVKRFLGEGAFGEVYRALNENGIERALKLIKKDEEWNERNEESLQRIKEIDLLQQVQHENLLRYFEHFDEVVFGVDCLCLVSELCENGDLKSQINYAQNTGKRISDLKIVRWMVEATTGLKHLHDEKIIHRNIKPSNLLLTKNNVIKLADFGVTKYIDSSLIFNLASCRAYMSPEISHFMQFTKKADIWSLGCVLFELANLKVAFPLGARFDDDQPVSIPELGSSRFTWILKSMLELNKEKRIDANDLFETLCFERSTIEEEEM